MKKCSLPARKECFEIMREYHVPLHVVEHSRTAAKLAVFLGERLKEKGTTVDIDLVDRACLLHDIVRVCDFKELDYDKFEQAVTEEDRAKWDEIRARYKGIRHEDAAYDILRGRYPALALTIKRHRYMAMLEEKERPETWEEKLVYYADMRVRHDKIVPLRERLEDGHKRNAFLRSSRTEGRISTAKVDSLIYRLEEEIFAGLGLDPVEVTGEFIDSYARKRPKED